VYFPIFVGESHSGQIFSKLQERKKKSTDTDLSGNLCPHSITCTMDNKLAALPKDIWSLIVNKLATSHCDVLNLYATGGLEIRHVIHATLCHLRIDRYDPTDLPVVWIPTSIVSHCEALTELLLVGFPSTSFTLDFRPTITKLTLVSPSHERRFDYSVTLSAPGLKQLSCSSNISLTFPESGPPPMLNSCSLNMKRNQLNTVFGIPNLQHIDLHSGTDLSVPLPDTITFLDCYIHHLSQLILIPENDSPIPASLSKLVVEFEANHSSGHSSWFKERIIDHLPVSLLTLDLNCVVLPLDVIESLPKGLTCLKLCRTKISNSCRVFLEMTSLQTLVVGVKWDVDQPLALPSSLKRLNIIGYSDINTKLHLSSLPPCIESLDYNQLHPHERVQTGFEFVRELPSTLQTLILMYPHYSSSNYFGQFKRHCWPSCRVN
jgi:hypothetical protein